MKSYPICVLLCFVHDLYIQLMDDSFGEPKVVMVNLCEYLVKHGMFDGLGSVNHPKWCRSP